MSGFITSHSTSGPASQKHRIFLFDMIFKIMPPVGCPARRVDFSYSPESPGIRRVNQLTSKLFC
jgi:hypothetical protein